MRKAALCFLFLAPLLSCTASDNAPATLTYKTQFMGAEDPLSEGGMWSHMGLDWSRVRKAGGLAFGTQTGTGGYDDSYARLSGFLPNQGVEATIHVNRGIDASCTHEVEILLRWSDAPHQATGYEVNISFNGSYAQIVRWNGALGAFTVLGGGSYGGLRDGDKFKATINGNIIAVFVNKRRIVQIADNTYKSGNPGIGFFRRNCGAGSDFGFSSLTATGSNGEIT